VQIKRLRFQIKQPSILKKILSTYSIPSKN